MAPNDSRQGATQPWLLLFVLSLAYACGAVDRLIISLLVAPMKSELGLTDTQIGILQGLALSLTYSIATIPVGLLVDRVSRTKLIAAGVAFWSVMTSLTGLAGRYGTLFACRAGVGLGEATLSPAAFSLIADSFPKHRHGLAIGLYNCGAAIGFGGSLILGGYVVTMVESHGPVVVPLLGELSPWRMAFLLLGAPGLLIALLVALFPEPRHSRAARPPPPRGMIAAFIKEHRLFLSFHHAGVGFCSMVTTGTAAWGAVLFARVHGWSPSQIGLAEGLALIAGGILGMLGGGALSDHLSRRGPHMRLVVCVFAALGAAGAGVSFPLVADPGLAIVLLGAVFMFAGMPFGAANAALQLIAPDAIRGAVSALFFFSLSMIGGLGPALIAILSDRWFPTPDGIRFAIAIVIPAASLLAAICYALSVGPYRRTSVVQQLNDGVKVPGTPKEGATAVADA